MFFEISLTLTKVSFRSFTGINVGSIAEIFGGGGHTYSSATIMNCDVKTAQNKILPKLNIIINKVRDQ